MGRKWDLRAGAFQRPGASQGLEDKMVRGPKTASHSPSHTHTAGKTPHLYSHSILGLLERKEIRTGSPIAHISPHRLLARYQPQRAPLASPAPPAVLVVTHTSFFFRKNMVSTKVQDTKGCRACCVGESQAQGVLGGWVGLALGHYPLSKAEARCAGPQGKMECCRKEADPDPFLSAPQLRALAPGARSCVGHWRRLWSCSSGTSR